LNKRITNNFKVEVGQNIKDEKRDIVIIELSRIKQANNKSQKFIRYKCYKCGYESDFVRETDLIGRNVGCSCCRGLSVAEGINDIPTTAPWMVPFFQNGYEEAKLYTHGSHSKIYPVCPNCGEVRDSSMEINTIYQKRSINCKCSDGRSYPSKFVIALLDQLNMNYEEEFAPEWLVDQKGCKRRFDFRVGNTIIEVDGEWHYKDNHLSGQSIDAILAIDEWKDKQAIIHGYNVFRIDAKKSEKEYLKEQIIKSIGEYFDLSHVSWSKCEEFATKNIIKAVCEYYESHKPITPTEVGKYFNIKRRQTIYDYLLKGTKIGWCHYDKESSIAISSKMSAKSREKSIEVYRNEILLDKYDSAKDIAKNSFNDFGVKLSRDGIAHMIIGNSNHYKGFTFKYIENAI